MLLIGTTGDPATPRTWTRAMAERLGEGVAVELTNEGEGHGAYGHSACVNDTVNAYFLDGRIPAVGTNCPPDVPSDAPRADTGGPNGDPGDFDESCPGVTAPGGPPLTARNRDS